MVIIATALVLLGLLSEIVGIILMARQFANVPWSEVVQVLFSALWRGPTARGMRSIAEMSGEKPVHFVQGLGFASLGITLQMIGTGFDLWHRTTPP